MKLNIKPIKDEFPDDLVNQCNRTVAFAVGSYICLPTVTEEDHSKEVINLIKLTVETVFSIIARGKYSNAEHTATKGRYRVEVNLYYGSHLMWVNVSKSITTAFV